MVRRDAGHPPNMALEHAPPNDEAAREFPLQDGSAFALHKVFPATERRTWVVPRNRILRPVGKRDFFVPGIVISTKS